MSEHFIAHYKVTGKLGAGGMGEVFRAEDTKLNREVAIKVLPKSLAQDRERLARFQREAELLASLNHPHIAAIHGLEESNDGKALVLELVEGDTLAERLKRGPLPIENALEVGGQIAEALEAAHQKDVIHRDLKPGNIKFTHDDKVKVLDFGLAKAVSEDQATELTAGPSDSPTITDHYTKPGTILGTAAYMSPEQARGKPVDKRTDIWSFGCVLFECLTGHCLFKGEEITQTLAKIIEREPDWSRLPQSTPPTVHLLLRKCLTKDRERRLHDIADARVDLEQALADPSSTFLNLTDNAISTSRPRHRGVKIVVAAAVGVVLGTMIGVMATKTLRPVEGPSSSLKVDITIDNLGNRRSPPVISPDGKRIVYSGSDQLWVRELGDRKPWKIPETEGAEKPFWSPTSESIGYFQNDGSIWKTALNSGSPELVARLDKRFGFSAKAGWSSDGKIWITTSSDPGQLRVVSDQSGVPEPVRSPDPNAGEAEFEDVSLLPHGRGAIFVIDRIAGSEDTIGVFAQQQLKPLLQSDGENFSNPIYSPATETILFEGSQKYRGLWAFPFSLKDLKRTGEPFVVEEEATAASISTFGTLVYVPSITFQQPAQLVWVNRSGQVEGTIGRPQIGIMNPVLSPNQSQVLVSAGDNFQRQLWIHDVDRATRIPLQNTLDGGSALWRPNDSTQIVYSKAQEIGTFAKLLDDAGEIQLLLEKGQATSFSSDGKYLAYQFHSGDSWDVGILDIESKPRIPTVLLDSPDNESTPQISPDGRFLAYQSNETDELEVYIIRLPDGTGKVPVSLNGGSFPKWSKDGTELFYVGPEVDTLFAVTIKSSPLNALPREIIGETKKLFDTAEDGLVLRFGRYLSYGYDLANDGRFIVVKTPETHTQPNVIVVDETWAESQKSKL